MIKLIRYVQARWDDWCGDRDMELAIRKHLTNNGYYGGTAKLRAVRLVAVQRPGWLQVFRFEVTARRATSDEEDAPDSPAQYDELYGLVRDDIRHKSNTVRVFSAESERIALFRRWSDGLLCLRGAKGLTGS
ncbi:MAG: hypothetical protein AAGA03_12165 [Planctomycetota bacterium]